MKAVDTRNGVEAGAGIVFQPENTRAAIGLNYDFGYGDDGRIDHLFSGSLRIFFD